MSGEAETIYHAALALPVAEREQLVDRLRQSIEDEADTPAAEEAAAIERRLDDVLSGRVRAVPGDEAYAAVLQRLRDGKRA